MPPPICRREYQTDGTFRIGPAPSAAAPPCNGRNGNGEGNDPFTVPDHDNRKVVTDPPSGVRPRCCNRSAVGSTERMVPRPPPPRPCHGRNGNGEGRRPPMILCSEKTSFRVSTRNAWTLILLILVGDGAHGVRHAEPECGT